MSEPLISVIVPIYKVEQYLHKCIDSIIGQTYKNLEIILVDDGSPDNCGEICDEYAAKDGRIKVIHQKNGGLSAARNSGLKICEGDYVGFVDSDDWIEADMYEYLITNAIEENADICCSSRFEEYSEKTTDYTWKDRFVLSKEKAIELLVEDNRIRNFMWDKLWKSNLFDGIWFPEGRNFEDIAVSYKLFEKAEKVLCLPEAKYHYLQRDSGIVSTKTLKNQIDYFLFTKMRFEDMSERWPDLHHMLEEQCISAAVGVWCSYFRSPKEMRIRYSNDLHEISEYIKPRYKKHLKTDRVGICGKAVIRLLPYKTWWAFAIARIVGLIYKMKNRCIL